MSKLTTKIVLGLATTVGLAVVASASAMPGAGAVAR